MSQLGCLGFRKQVTEAKEGRLEFRGEKGKGNAPGGRGDKGWPGRAADITSFFFKRTKMYFSILSLLGICFVFDCSITIDNEVINICSWALVLLFLRDRLLGVS